MEQLELDNSGTVDMTWLENSDVFRYFFDWNNRLPSRMCVYMDFNGVKVPHEYIPSGVLKNENDTSFVMMDKIIIGWHLDNYLQYGKPNIEVRMNKKRLDGYLTDSLQFHTDYYGEIGDDILIPRWMLYKARNVVRTAMNEKSSKWKDFESSGDLMRNVLYTAGPEYREFMPLVKKVFGEDYQPDMFVEPDKPMTYAQENSREMNSMLADEVMNVKHSDIHQIKPNLYTATPSSSREIWKLLGGKKDRHPYPEYINVTFHLNPGFPWGHTSIAWISYYFDASTMERIQLVCACQQPGTMWSISSITPGSRSKLSLKEIGREFRNIPTPVWMDRIALRWAMKAKDEAEDQI